ncbi:S-methyl-5'-thioadenosine phosphorylase [Halosegnis marinus]|uniref:Purine nucleoside phosphorylase n=1 Tax=Halosegnis marinus TaxID=3034023 RepID=A0ABD5ZQD2_9EURY|nr:S-methyl-5'-thioadenosine phosphorylase [Halosegnis sp. DT85]
MIGFIGGSGIYDSLPLEDTEEHDVTTPYGDPAAPVTVGAMPDGTGVAFLPRHGRDHQYSPTTAPYRANIYALKELGVERVLASNAVGSLREDLPPRTLVVPDQIFDRTRKREYTFFDEGCVVHMPFAEPYCPHMKSHLAESAREASDAEVHEDGTYVCIEGPQYSTKAESEHFRASGFEIIGMTAIPEAKLAREAELCYATVAGVTDYDVWKEESEVTLQEVLDNAAANEEFIKSTVRRAVENMPEARECDCGHAVEGSVNTPTEAIPEDVRERVELLVGDYL